MLGLGLWTFLGPAGYSVCVVYLVLGSAVTRVRMDEKEVPLLSTATANVTATATLTPLHHTHTHTHTQREGIAEKRGGARGPENVWGSAATAMLCALATSYAAHGHHLSMASMAGARPFWEAALRVGYVAALATKLSDTFQV